VAQRTPHRAAVAHRDTQVDGGVRAAQGGVAQRDAERMQLHRRHQRPRGGRTALRGPHRHCSLAAQHPPTLLLCLTIPSDPIPSDPIPFDPIPSHPIRSDPIPSASASASASASHLRLGLRRTINLPSSLPLHMTPPPPSSSALPTPPPNRPPSSPPPTPLATPTLPATSDARCSPRCAAA
jgi:hypothetical protein